MEFKHYHADHHLIACLGTNLASQMIVDLLPECDLSDELNELLNAQFEVLTTYIEGEHYGTKSLNEILDKVSATKIQIQEMKNATE